MNISLCVITRNESINIKGCIDSAQQLADEVIVVDTGSDDNTETLAREVGAAVYHYNWNGDFSEARNYALSKACGGWILFLDADERLRVSDAARVRNAIEKCTADAIQIKLLHIDGDAAHISHAPRLFRNDARIRYSGKIHEMLNVTAAAPAVSGLSIEHFGYTTDALARKGERNLSMLALEPPNEPRVAYHIAAELFNAGDHSAALEHVNRALLLYLQNGVKPPSYAYKLKYDILLSSRQYNTTLAGINKAIELYPDYTNLCFIKAVCLYKAERCADALKLFTRCLIQGEASSEYLTLCGCGSNLALYGIGLCHSKLGRVSEAAEAFRQAEASAPNVKRIFENL